MRIKLHTKILSGCQFFRTGIVGNFLWVFEIFQKKGGSDFCHKKRGVGKLGWGGGGVEKGGIIYFHTD